MFRENDFRYLISALVTVLILTIVSIVYEWRLVDDDSWLDTIVAIIRWQGVILPLTIICIALFEVTKVIANRMIAHFKQKDRAEGRAEGRAEEREAWRKWNTRRLEAASRDESFNEPTPAERDPQ